MMSIKKLPQEVVNQIAAGEVIERPASVVKELVDNSIDAGSTYIEISIIDGGKKLIKVVDNGSGIPKEDLAKAFEAHTTSKINSLDDLNDLLTMGFRGEALSTIVAVSDLSAISKTKDSPTGYKVVFKGIEPSEITDFPSRNGTTIEVNDLFKNIPARYKYLRSFETEYRNILKTLIPYFIYYPDIHFILKKDGKTTYNLPSSKNSRGSIDDVRVTSTLRSDFTKDMVPLFFEGNGIDIGGFIARPSHHKPRVDTSYIFLNGRPISDNGIYKSVLQGYGTYIPHGEKIPFILALSMPSSMVDINVHPRKEEVRFINPYRVYSAVEEAINSALEKNVKIEDSFQSENNIAYERLRGDSDTVTRRSSSNISDKSYSNKQYSFGTSFPPSKNKVDSSIIFTKELLKGNEIVDENEIKKLDLENIEEPVNVFQIFNKYIVLEFSDQLWFIDQHAAAERITYEMLLNRENRSSDIQEFLMPKTININDITRSFLIDNKDLFTDLGFNIEIKDETIQVSSSPVEFAESDLQKMFDQILVDDLDGYESGKGIESIKNGLLATMACHNSIRSNQRMEKEEMYSIVNRLSKCKNGYSCPHGRPIVWKLNINELDSKFLRTY